MRLWFILSACLVFFSQVNAQYITGIFPDHANQRITLSGFDGFKTHVIDSVKPDVNGNFKLSFGRNDYGMALLSVENVKPFIVILDAGEDLELEGNNLEFPETIKIKSGSQNKLLRRYSGEHPRRELALSAWDYLDKMYSSDYLFSSIDKPKRTIRAEKLRLIKEDNSFLNSLEKGSYLSWYLPVSNLISSVTALAQYRSKEIPSAIADFRKIDYTDSRLFKSGLSAETIEAHFWLIENSGKPLDSIYIEMNRSIDILLENLISDKEEFNEITDYLFKYLEQHSLFKSSEYLALKVLNEAGCNIGNDLAARLESYRAMKIGNTAPDFILSGNNPDPGHVQGLAAQRLSGLPGKFKLVIFGASWCPHCPDELLTISRLYEKWKKYDIQVVFFSLDVDSLLFKNFSTIFPFISICDYQKWESPVVKSWHVFATPSLFLLDDKLKILLKPISVQQMDAWVDWYLTGNNIHGNANAMPTGFTLVFGQTDSSYIYMYSGENLPEEMRFPFWNQNGAVIIRSDKYTTLKIIMPDAGETNTMHSTISFPVNNLIQVYAGNDNIPYTQDDVFVYPPSFWERMQVKLETIKN